MFVVVVRRCRRRGDSGRRRYVDSRGRHRHVRRRRDKGFVGGNHRARDARVVESSCVLTRLPLTLRLLTCLML